MGSNPGSQPQNFSFVLQQLSTQGDFGIELAYAAFRIDVVVGRVRFDFETSGSSRRDSHDTVTPRSRGRGDFRVGIRRCPHVAGFDDPRVLPGNRLHALSGDVRGFHGVRVNEQVADRVSVRSRRARRSVHRLSLGHSGAADPSPADAGPVQCDFTIAIRSDSHVETLPFHVDVGRSASCEGRSRP